MQSSQRSRRQSALILLGLVSEPGDGAPENEQGWLARLVLIVVVVIVANILADTFGLSGLYRLLAYVGAGLIVGVVNGLVLLAISPARRR